jgi:hypothetical protein
LVPVDQDLIEVGVGGESEPECDDIGRLVAGLVEDGSTI